MATTDELLQRLARNREDFARCQPLLTDDDHLEPHDHELMDRIQVLIDLIETALLQRQREAERTGETTSRSPPNRDRRNKRKQELAAMRQRMQRVMDQLGL